MTEPVDTLAALEALTRRPYSRAPRSVTWHEPKEWRSYTIAVGADETATLYMHEDAYKALQQLVALSPSEKAALFMREVTQPCQ